MSTHINCHRCGGEVPEDSRFCPYCGIGVPQRPSHLSQRHGLIALTATSAWVLATLVAKSLDVSLAVALFNTALLLPAIISLSLAVYVLWKQRSTEPLTQIPFSPAIALLVTLVWFLVSMLLASDPGEPLITGIIWWVATFGFALAWLAVFVAAIQTIGASAWSVLRRTMWVVVYVVPLPVAVYLAMLLAGQEALPLKARFELSEAALFDDVKQPQEGSHRAGLFQITLISKIESCSFLETGGADLGDGLAYCPDGQRPIRAMRDSPPDIVMQPLDGDWQTADWWSYEVVESSSY